MELPKMYFEALLDNPLREIMHHNPTRVNRGKDIPFSSRSCFHKMARVVYKVTRSFYVSVVFYFVPFFVIVLNTFYSKVGDEHHAAE